MKYSNIDYTNDVKVLGRVVSITMDDKVAEAEQVFDTPFKYNDSTDYDIDEEKTGLSQYEINRLLKYKVWLLDNAGLIPEDQNAPIVIDNPVEFKNIVDAIDLSVSNDLQTKNLDVTNAAQIKEATVTNDLTVGGNVLADNVVVNHTITANDIIARQLLKGTTLQITGTNSTIGGSLTIGGPLTVTGKTTLNGGLDVHGNAKFFNNLTVDGDTTVVNLTVNGTFNAPHATTSTYGVVRLATALNSTADDDVVPVSLFRQYYQYLLDNNDATAIDSIKELLDYVNQNGANIPTQLNDLNDVTLTTPAAGDIMYYDGTKWINTKLSTLLNNLKQEILNEVQSSISGACLWKVQNDYLVPTVSGRNVATTGNGKFYSGI